MSDFERFDFAFDRSYQATAGVFGIKPGNTWVDVGSRTLDVRFGPWRLSTPLSNITGAAVTGPYAFWKTAGPARLAFTDRGTHELKGVPGRWEVLAVTTPDPQLA